HLGVLGAGLLLPLGVGGDDGVEDHPVGGGDERGVEDRSREAVADERDAEGSAGGGASHGPHLSTRACAALFRWLSGPLPVGRPDGLPALQLYEAAARDKPKTG